MKIKQIYSYSFFIFFLIALLITSFIIVFSGVIQNTLNTNTSGFMLQREVQEMEILITDINDNNRERVWQQYQGNLKEVKRHIQILENSNINDDDQMVLETMTKSIEKIDEIVVKIREKTNVEALALLESQMKFEDIKLNEQVLLITSNLNERLMRVINIAKGVAISLLIFLLIMIFFLWQFLHGKILRPLGLIQNAITHYHNGDFEHRIDYLSEDEIGDLTLMLDEMSENLKKSTVKKEELEEELVLNENLNNVLEGQKNRMKELLRKNILANNSKDIFLANMSHEMRTPLSGIMGTLELLQSQELSEDSKYLLSLSMESTVHLSHIVDDLLEVSKMYTGKYELNPEYCNPGKIFEESFSLYKITALDKKLDYNLSYDMPKQIYIDSKRLFQLINNLISNAVKFTSQGFVKIKADFEKQNNKEGILFIRVKDSGIGIDEEIKRYIFDFFYQKDMSFTKDYQGMGIGLAIVKNIVLKMKGKMHFVSEINRGTEFIIQLPIQYLENGGVNLSSKSIINAKKVKIKKILVVEDNVINRLIIRKILEKKEYEIEEAENGKVALELCEHKDNLYDLIFMDIQMPLMNGLTAMKKIKQLKIREKQIIIALTGYKSDEDKERLLEEGFDGYISKPYSEKTIFDYIELFDKRSKDQRS